MKIFQLAPWVAATLYSTAVTAGSLKFPRQYGGYNITEDVLQVANSVSSPTCNATQPCIELVTVVVPRCLRLRGDAGCWCGNHDPVHYCALCMSNPTDNTTTPDQTQGATNGHTRFHGGCAAFEAVLNGTIVTTTSSSSAVTSTVAATQANSNTGTGSKTNTGAIIGGAVGGVVGLALIAGICFIAYQMIKRKPAIDPYTNRPMSTVTSPELKYATPSPPPMQLPPAGSPQAFGHFAGQPPQPNGMATYGTPLPYTGPPAQPPPNPQRESTYDTRML